MYETGQSNNKSIDSICSSDEEFSLLTKILMTENINEDYQKILSEIIKNFKLKKLNNKKNEIINKMKTISTNDERELLETELKEVMNELGQLMIR